MRRRGGVGGRRLRGGRCLHMRLKSLELVHRVSYHEVKKPIMHFNIFEFDLCTPWI